MRGGQLRHVIEFQSAVETIGRAGDPQPEWNETTPFATVSASIEPLRASELIQAGGVGYQATHRVRTRWFDGLLPNMRIRHGVRYFGIAAIRNMDERNREYELIVMEGQGQGR